MDWLVTHPDALLGYEGEWVAIADGRIIAHAASMITVESETRESGFDDPLLVAVIAFPFVGHA